MKNFIIVLAFMAIAIVACDPKDKGDKADATNTGS